MIRLPKEISAALCRLDKAGLNSYVAGSCVLESLTDETPYYWTIITEGQKETALATIAEEKQKAETNQELEITLQSSPRLEQWLQAQPFTVYAMASHPQKGFLDPLNGRADVEKRLVRTAGDATALFDSKPQMALEVLCLVAELDFDVEPSTYMAMQNAAEKVKSLAPAVQRDQFMRILTGKAAAKALRMSAGCGALEGLLGRDCYPPESRHERQQLETLTLNLDLAASNPEYRYALLFLCFDRQRAVQAITRLGFDETFHQLMVKAVTLSEDLYFASDKHKFKSFLGKVGRETYEYLHTLSKQQRKVYDLPEYRIRSRIYMMKEYEALKLPLFLEDLAVTAEDLWESGVAGNLEEGEALCAMLLDVIHNHPGKNTKQDLVKKARAFKKNPIKAALRGVRWYK